MTEKSWNFHTVLLELASNLMYHYGFVGRVGNPEFWRHHWVKGVRTGNYNIVNLEILDFLMHCEAKRTFLMPITQINEIFWKSRNILSHTIFQSQFKNLEATLSFLLALSLLLPSPPNVSFVVSFQELISVSTAFALISSFSYTMKEIEKLHQIELSL